MKKFKKPVHASRRQFLGMMGSAALTPMLSSPLQVLLTSLTDGIFNKAQAQATGSLPRNYVFINLGGGPARWVWDMPLTPYRQESIIDNAHVKTMFTGSTQAGYVTQPITRNGVTLNLPHLWTTNIPTVGGGSVPMASLLDHMLMIRGVKLPSDGHDNNNFKILRPLNSSPSLNGAVADHSGASVPAVALPDGYKESYKSARGIAQSSIQDYFSGDPLGSLLSPFEQGNDGLSSNFMSKNQAMEAAMNTALMDLSNQAKQNLPGGDALFSMRYEAYDLLKRGIGDLSGTFNQIRSKYRNLIQRVATGGIPGVTNVGISIGSLPQKNGLYSPVKTGLNSSLGPGDDLRNVITSNSDVINLSENFAIAEYLLVNGYSSAVNMGSQSLGGLGFDWGYDEHEGGSFLSLIANSFLFSALSACIYELVSVLKSNNLFDETVIQVGGEFSRSARTDHTGSDHGWAAYTTSVFCGAINQPMVLGNVVLQTPDWYPNYGMYQGTWGVSGAVKVDGVDQELTLGHSTSTVAHLLRVEPPLPNNGSLVSESNGRVEPVIELARNINNT